MSTGIRPRGRLPQRVYWFRRATLLVLALGLVYGLGHLLGGGGGAPQSTASQAADHPSVTATPSATPATRKPRTKKTTPPKVVLAQPDGPCLSTDVTVTPSTRPVQAGKPIALDLILTTTRPACTFTVSPKTVVVKITSGSDRIWSSQDCPKAVPDADVVVRAQKAATVAVSWSGRRSDSTCSRATDWANIGYYHATAATYGGQATDVQFRLVVPKRPVVIRTEKPKKQPSSTPTPKASSSPGASGKG